MTPSTIAGILGIIALAFLALLILKQLTQPSTDFTAKLFSLLLLGGLMALTGNVVYRLFELYDGWPHLANVFVAPVFWIGPALFGYTKRLSRGESLLGKRYHLLHWLPCILAVLLLSPYYALPIEEKILIQRDPTQAGIYTTLMQIIWTVVFVQILLYIYFCQPFLRDCRFTLSKSHSDFTRNNLSWLQLFCYGFVAWVLLYLLLPFTDLGTSEYRNVISMAMHMFVVMLTYSAIGKSALAPVIDNDFEIANGFETERVKYQHSGLRKDSASFLLNKLTRSMAENQYYLDSDISLDSLATKLNINPHHLSQLLNAELNKTFYEYINEQRVQYAQALLIDKPGKSVFDVALKSGFNNKNSFNNAFKRHAGMTPSAFREKH